MAASDMRSSSARPTFQDRLGILSSSPSFPDLQDLIATKAKPKSQILRSGSAAAPIPENASTAFTSASSLLRMARTSVDNSLDVIDEPHSSVSNKAPAKRVRKITKETQAPKKSKAAKVSKSGKGSRRVAKEVIVLSSDGVTPKFARHVDPEAGLGGPLGDAVEVRSNEGSPLKTKPWKKFKAPPSPDQIGTGDVGKASARPQAKAKLQRKKDKMDTVIRQVSKEEERIESGKAVVKEKRPRASTPEPTNLELAVQRRVDWTPAKPDTVIPQSSRDLSGSPDAFISTRADDTGPDATDLFRNLRDTYGHKAADAGVAAAPEQQTAKVLGKRKAIEMVSINMASKSTRAIRGPSPTKAKAPKKKPRTITELATAAYAPRMTEEDENIGDSLLEYFSIEDPEQDVSKDAAAKGKGKAAKMTKRKKKTAPKKPMLLSPQSAMAQSAAQDFVFGTASQLAREKSPTFLKDLHAAMKASTIAEEDDPFAQITNDDSLQSKVRGKGLWSVSARDEGGELVDVEIIDLINSPALPQDDAILDPWTQLPPEAACAETETADSSVIEIDSRPVATNQDKSSQAPVPRSHFFMTQKMTLNAAAAISTTRSDESFPLVTDLLEDEMPPPSNQQQTQEEVRESPGKATAPVPKPRPKYETFTDAKLAKEISTFGFKTVKTRNGMIALLDQCWKRKTQASVTGAAFSTTSVLASPKRKQAETAKDPATICSPQAKKSRSKAKRTTDEDPTNAEESRGTRAKKGPAEEDASILPKKKVGRPRKTATAAASKEASAMPPPPRPEVTPTTPKRKKSATRAEMGVVDMDLDSEIEASGSSPEQLFSPSGADADVTISEDTEISLNLSPTAQQSTLFSHITKAVTSAPRTTDLENPSWHEKMLMYDPVILEDLTAWLNSGELTRLGCDDEVAPQDVKKWCESRSICCLWRGNWHGKERKRF